MCGRFALKTTTQAIREMFLLEEGEAFEPHYNIAPSMKIPAVWESPEKGRRQMTLLKWGLVPSWAKDPAIGNKMINARAESAAEKPAFRAPFRRKRCLIPADGFYEWKKPPEGKKVKQPYFVKRADGKLLAFAGLWDCWRAPDGGELKTCTILTTQANEIMQPIHDRMPVILPEKNFAVWLDPKNQDPKKLSAVLQPYPSENLVAYPVSLAVNSPQNDTPECLEPVAL